MSQGASAEAIIAIAAKLKDQVAALYSAYVRLPEVINDEHEAIKSGSISIIESTCVEKTKLGDEIEDCFHVLRRAAEDLTELLRPLAGGDKRDIVTLKDCAGALEDLLASLGDGGLGTQVLSHQIAGLKQLIKEFDGQAKRVKPLIEMNKYLTETMLRNQQESYRFWVSLVEENESAYNAQGVQKVQGRHSAFKVTA